MDVYGLIGNPVGHSLSPPMHEAAYEELGMNARYVTFEPEPEAIESVITGAQALGIQGLNVTIPFKQDVLEQVTCDPTAERIGAVNTIDFSTDPPTGYNTDITGVIRTFKHHDITLEDRTAVIIGAGGAARAVAFALADAGAEFHIVNRTESKAESLAAELEGATAGGLSELPSVLPDADILINATSVGMEEDQSPVSAELLHADLTVFDAVYRPLQTKLLRDAQAVGAETIDGAWMLLYQGVAAFEIWTDKEAPVSTMNQELRNRLE